MYANPDNMKCLTGMYNENDIEDRQRGRVVTADTLRDECLKERYRRRLANADVFPTAANWQYFIERGMTGIGPGLYRKYLVSNMMAERDRTQYHQAAIRYFAEYLAAVPREYALEVVYSDTESCPDATVRAIIDARLFDAGRLLELLAGDASRLSMVVDCLAAYQPEYLVSDVYDMLDLLDAVINAKAVGQIVEMRNVFGGVMRYICPNGHTNSVTDDYCQHPDCGLNIYGLTSHQDEVIAEYRERLDILKRMLEI